MTATVLRQIPNLITVARVLLVIPTAWCLVVARYEEAVALMAVAGASDAVDGWLARHFNWVSRFGTALDPLADKILVGVLFIVLTVEGALPLWVAGIAIGRDLVILGGAACLSRTVQTHRIRADAVEQSEHGGAVQRVAAVAARAVRFPVRQ